MHYIAITGLWTRVLLSSIKVMVMRLYVKVTPNAMRVKIKKLSERTYEIRVDAPADKGKANARLLEIIAEHFDAPKSSLRIISGFASRNKIIEIST